MVNGTCNHCGNGIEDDEEYQHCGGDSYLCESCSYKFQCAECGEIIDNRQAIMLVGSPDDRRFYHDDCVPDGLMGRAPTDIDLEKTPYA